MELGTSQGAMEPDQRAIIPRPDSSSGGEPEAAAKDELSALKAGLRRVKILTRYVSATRSKKAGQEENSSEGRSSCKSEESEYNSPYDTDCLDDSEGGESEEGKGSSSVMKSFNYGTLAYVNNAGGSFYSNKRIGAKDEDWVYYSYCRSDVGSASPDVDRVASMPQPAQVNSSKRGILSWRKRKLSFRSSKAKGEPLLKKAYAEEGGDDIDYDRRQLSSDQSLTFGVRNWLLNFLINCLLPFSGMSFIFCRHIPLLTMKFILLGNGILEQLSIWFISWKPFSTDQLAFIYFFKVEINVLGYIFTGWIPTWHFY